MKLVFSELYIFSPSEKKAKYIEFIDGINIVTSSQEDGTDRGKSAILKSLYHSMGAEAHFDKQWKRDDKVYVLKFMIDEMSYYIYRSEGLFKLFDADLNFIFSTISARELSEKLKKYTKFAVQLPNRNEKMEITPPAYNYLPFFLDQDHYDGNSFDSFARLGQYTNFRENALFYHLGAYDEEYFELIHNKEQIKEQSSVAGNKLEVLTAMLESLDRKMLGASFTSSYEALEKDIAMFQSEYASVLDSLAKSKNKLIKLRNELYDTERLIKEIEEVNVSKEKRIRKLRAHICPECGSVLTDTIHIKSKEYNLIEDAIAIKNELQISLKQQQQSIEKEEDTYRSLLSQMQRYEEKLKIHNSEADEILKQKGLSEVRDQVVSDYEELTSELEQYTKKLKEINTAIKLYDDKKKEIETLYYQLLVDAKTKFAIGELSSDSFKKLTNVVKGSGSNKNVVTIIWYIAVLELRKKFNPDAVVFPVVFDSINNVETDNEKKYGLVQYVVDKCKSDQLILSLLGYEERDIVSDRAVNVITLTNEKNQLLDEESYEQYKDLLEQLCDAQ